MGIVGGDEFTYTQAVLMRLGLPMTQSVVGETGLKLGMNLEDIILGERGQTQRPPTV
jgi:hypothetical protein